jgi:hypothetical protein
MSDSGPKIFFGQKYEIRVLFSSPLKKRLFIPSDLSNLLSCFQSFSSKE